jgi:hypothetical protein
MKTTIEIPDELFRKAKAVAALRGQSMKQFITQSIMTSLQNPTDVQLARREPTGSNPADTFSQELATLAAQISGAWQGPQDAAAAIREQRRELGTDVDGH